MELLEEASDEEGRPLRVVPVEMPKKKVGGDERLPASYANFYIGNSAVLVPTFDDVNDGAALSKLRSASLAGRSSGSTARPLSTVSAGFTASRSSSQTRSTESPGPGMEEKDYIELL